MSKTNIIAFVAATVILSAAIFESLSYFKSQGMQNGAEKSQAKEPAKVTLEFWGLWDDSDKWQPIIDKFEKETHTWDGQEVKVKINYTKKDISTYESDLEKYSEQGKAPGIFMINNYWLQRYAERLEPLARNVAYIEEYNLLNYEKLQDIFPPNILEESFDSNNEMYGMPVYSDSLALYYNKDLFQKAGIQNPPTTWDELKSDTKKLTLLGKKNEIKQSGIALGEGKNVNRSCDILLLLMMQGGSKVITKDGIIDFNKEIDVNTSQGVQKRQPGLTAIQFYMEFSDPQKEIYSWNDAQPNSIQAFADGKTAMMFGYSYQIGNLLALKPELNYGIAPVPQLANSTPINVSNMWMPVVSKQKSCLISNGNPQDVDCAKIAWSFLSFANQKENISEYLDATGKASARIDLLEEQSAGDGPVKAFAQQATMNRSYDKYDDRIDSVLIQMLDDIYNDRGRWKVKADETAAKIEELKNKAQ